MRQIRLFYNAIERRHALERADRFDELSLMLSGKPSPTAARIRKVYNE